MASNSLSDDQKVMDVSKPGKGKVVAGSRPVVAPIVSNEKSTKKAAPDPAPTKDEAAVVTESIPAPSEARKVIKPINDLSADAPEEGAPLEVLMPAEPEEAKAEPVEPTADSSIADTSKEQDSPDEPAEGTDASDDAASVDALVSKAQTKKEAAKKAEEQAKKDAELQKLIDSKQYHVPIDHGLTKKASIRAAWSLAVLLILAVLAAGYLLIDAGVIGSNIKLPYEFIKESESTQDSSTEAAGVSEANSGDKAAEQDKPDKAESSSPAGTSTPEQLAQDDEIKSELKNLQVKAEAYFGDNGAYPMSFDAFEPALTADETSGPNDQPYSYTSDGESYVLNASLSDGTEYTLNSLNQ